MPMRTDVVLTVSEGKRLIAKGVAKLDFVQRALSNGMVAICKGTTNSYVVEELLGTKIERTKFCTGTTWPVKAARVGKVANALPDVVLRNGQPVEGMTTVKSVAEMKEGDVFIKGANALNYGKRVAGILIGDRTGGTIGATWGYIIARRIRLVIPVSLEKDIPYDINEAATRINSCEDKATGPALFPVTGYIITEIEALKTLTGADAFPIAAGGIGGAEGALRLCVMGTHEQLVAAEQLLESICGEPPFIA
jgi:hypothetical protein